MRYNAKMATIRELIREVPCPACGARSGGKCFPRGTLKLYHGFHGRRLAAYRVSLGLPAKRQVRGLSR